MKGYVFPRGCDSARVISVIETKAARGIGTQEQPTRMVTEYWSLDGEKLAEHDPYTFIPSDSGSESAGTNQKCSC